jgi:hypothetical protein
VAQEAAAELPGPGRLEREVVGAGDRQPLPLEGDEVGKYERQEDVRGGGQDVRDGEDRVVEHLAPRGQRADAVPGDVAEHDRGDEQRERVRQRRPDEIADTRADVGDARPEVAVQQSPPEVDVLLPQRLIEVEGLREETVQLRRRGRVRVDS